MSFGFPTDLEDFLGSLAEMLRNKGHKQEFSIVADAVATLREEENVENYGGTLTSWTMILALNHKLYMGLERGRTLLGSRHVILDASRRLISQFGQFGRHTFLDVLIVPQVVTAKGWREAAKKLTDDRASSTSLGDLAADLFPEAAKRDADAEREPTSWHDEELKALATPVSAKQEAPLPTAKAPVAEAQPMKIFLSHKGIDKPRVRNYFETLKLLGFDPWLDEDAMAAGTNLHRGILKGMKESCAVVFFVTPKYVDDGYLATEIDYAINEKTQRRDGFAIITLVFGQEHEKGKVPDLLRPYVWKEPADDLEGLRVILRGLPVKIGPVP